MATTTERPPDDALTAIKTRRSVKECLPSEIPREWIEELLDAAIQPAKLAKRAT